MAAGSVAIVLWLLAGAPPARAHAHEALRTQCLLQAADPRNPWALAHGITALGATFAAKDGRKASDVIVGDYLKQGGPKDPQPFAFERFAPDGTPIEPHTNLNTKTLVLAGVPLSTTFKTSFGKVTLKQLVESVQAGFAHSPQSEEYWRDSAWTLDLLAATHKPGKAAIFKNSRGDEIDLNVVMEEALAYLELAQKDLGEGMDEGQAQVPKRKQGVYGHTCGGLHLFQAVASWARYPEVRKQWGKRFDRQVAILFYRLGSEQGQYEEALQKLGPQYRLQILTQMLKFYGHFLETTGRLKAECAFKPTEAQAREVEKAKALLDRAVRELEEVKAFETMDRIKLAQPQVYLDLIGDSCHAAHGLEFWK
jgi:hypothetical protein